MAEAKQSHHHPDYDQRIKALEEQVKKLERDQRPEAQVGNPRPSAHALRDGAKPTLSRVRHHIDVTQVA